MTKKEQQADSLQKELEKQQSQASEKAKAAEAAKQRLAQHKQRQEEAKTRLAALRHDRDVATDKRKKVWRRSRSCSRRSRRTGMSSTRRAVHCSTRCRGRSGRLCSR